MTPPPDGVRSVSRYPCRLCGDLMVGDDTYVVCRPCLARFELPAEQEDSPLPQAMTDALVRRLLDDW